jgi:predicted enzyme related to lactoylglutathione lyase
VKITSSRDVLLQSENLPEALAFYENVMGLKVTHRSDTLMGFETGSFCLYVDKGPAYGPVFEFHVPDLEAAKKALTATGCKIEQEDPSIPRCYMRDPFGLVFNLNQRKD